MHILKRTRQAAQRLGRLGLRLLAGFWGIVPELCGLGGGLLLYDGIRDIYPPAAKITLGVIVLAIAWRLAKAEAAERARREAAQRKEQHR